MPRLKASLSHVKSLPYACLGVKPPVRPEHGLMSKTAACAGLLLIVSRETGPGFGPNRLLSPIFATASGGFDQDRNQQVGNGRSRDHDPLAKKHWLWRAIDARGRRSYVVGKTRRNGQKAQKRFLTKDCVGRFW